MTPLNRILPHPGEILFEEFIRPKKRTVRAVTAAVRCFANKADIHPRSLWALITGIHGLHPLGDTADKLAKATGTTPEFWLNLQRQHDESKKNMEGK